MSLSLAYDSYKMLETSLLPGSFREETTRIYERAQDVGYYKTLIVGNLHFVGPTRRGPKLHTGDRVRVINSGSVGHVSTVLGNGDIVVTMPVRYKPEQLTRIP